MVNKILFWSGFGTYPSSKQPPIAPNKYAQ